MFTLFSKCLFKARSLKDRNIIEGYPVRNGENYYLLPLDKDISDLNVKYLIDKNTLVKWTGTVDYKNRKVYEGDVIHSSRLLGIYGVVVYKNGRYVIASKKKRLYCLHCFIEESNLFDIKGNVFDSFPDKTYYTLYKEFSE